MTMKLPEFDVLIALHRQNPEDLEQLRRQLLREAIASAPVSQRASLEHLVLQINCARESAENPMEATIAAFSLMQASLARLQAGWQQAATALAGLQTAIVLERMRR